MGNTSKYYELTSQNQIAVKPDMPYVELNMALFNHKIDKNSTRLRQTIDIVFSEDVKNTGDEYEILRYTVNIDTVSFPLEIKYT